MLIDDIHHRILMNVHGRKLLFANGVQTKMVNAIEATARYGY